MIFNLLSECLPYPFHPKGGTTLYGQLPALLRAKISVAFSLSNACFLQIKITPHDTQCT